MSKRNYQIDVVKGLLVETMVFFHSIQYFDPQKSSLLNHLSYVTGAFVFISGYLSSWLDSDNTRDLRRKNFFRNINRGIKIILIFILSNFLIQLILNNKNSEIDYVVQLTIENVYNIFLFGDKGATAFEILLPIGYTIIITSFFIYFRSTRLITVIFLILTVTISDINNPPFNLYYFSIGIGGFVIGIYFKCIENIDKSNWQIITGLSLCAYNFTIFFLKVDIFIVYFAGIVSTLSGFYIFSRKCNNKIAIYILSIFGRYTLICYLSQIAMLQIIKRLLQLHIADSALIFGSIGLINVLMLSECIIIDVLKKRFSVVNTIYSAVFR